MSRFLVLYTFRISKAGGAERDRIEDVLSVLRVPRLKKRHSSLKMLCDGSVSDVIAQAHASSSSCMEVDQLESNFAAIRGLVHTMWLKARMMVGSNFRCFLVV